MNGDPRALSYCRGKLKRSTDLLLSATALLVLSPLLALLLLLQLVCNGRPVLFRQQRVGIGGTVFTLIKFRSMRAAENGGPSVTASGDRRITPWGRFLRASKLDELPQLINVFAGEMSIVGPRPELPRYVKLYSESQRRVLDVRPGLSDPAALHFRHEERILAAVDPAERESYYVREIMPRKLALNLAYLEQASLSFDALLILRTLGAVVLPGKP